MSNEKMERLQKKKEKLDQQLEKMKEESKQIYQQLKTVERKERTRRLINVGGLTEKMLGEQGEEEVRRKLERLLGIEKKYYEMKNKQRKETGGETHAQTPRS